MFERMLIAEIGSVHDGSIGNALQLIKLASECGASAVKFQTHIALAESTMDAPSPSFFNSEDRVSYFKRTSFTVEQWKILKRKSDECGMLFLSSPFSIEAVDILEEAQIEMYKIPSGEVTNLPLLEKIAKIGKPVLLSSGMSDWAELDVAVDIFKNHCDFLVMQCTSSYPCGPHQVGLNILDEIVKRYNCQVGFSDHTLGFAAPIAAAALGATAIEKHFTFSRHMYGSDAKHSMEPDDFTILANSIKEIWQALDSPIDKSDNSKYVLMKEVFEKSIVASCHLPRGTVVEFSHMSFKKPGTGISAGKYKDIIGKVVQNPMDPDEQFNEKNLA